MKKFTASLIFSLLIFSFSFLTCGYAEPKEPPKFKKADFNQILTDWANKLVIRLNRRGADVQLQEVEFVTKDQDKDGSMFAQFLPAKNIKVEKYNDPETSDVMLTSSSWISNDTSQMTQQVVTLGGEHEFSTTTIASHSVTDTHEKHWDVGGDVKVKFPYVDVGVNASGGHSDETKVTDTTEEGVLKTEKKTWSLSQTINIPAHTSSQVELILKQSTYDAWVTADVPLRGMVEIKFNKDVTLKSSEGDYMDATSKNNTLYVPIEKVLSQMKAWDVPFNTDLFETQYPNVIFKAGIFIHGAVGICTRVQIKEKDNETNEETIVLLPMPLKLKANLQAAGLPDC